MLKRIGRLALPVAVVFLSGCTTLGSMVGIASEEYVDARIAEVQVDVQMNRNSIEEVSEDVERFEATASAVEEALVSVEQAVTTTEELKQLAEILEDRLENLPKETIRQLVEILRAHLDE